MLDDSTKLEGMDKVMLSSFKLHASGDHLFNEFAESVENNRSEHLWCGVVQLVRLWDDDRCGVFEMF